MILNIKIFVSHRIDINSELIDNPIYYPVRCGAVFDKENPMNIAGDDTGDNISERRMSFCEFTVQYWAWKNMDCDYYGLCHYRRYLSFAEKRYKTDEYNFIYVPILTPSSKSKFGLLDKNKIASLISDFDMIVSEYADVKNIPTPCGKKQTVRELWDAHDNVFFEKETIDLMFELIDEKSPEYSKSAREYFNGGQHRGFNCYIMKKALFNRLCEFQFPIMFEIEKRVNTTGYTQTMKRTPAFIGEMLYGIFTYHVINYENIRVKELQLIFFKNTDKIKNQADLFKRIFLNKLDIFARAIFDPFFPKGTKRREIIKTVFYKVSGAKHRGAADIK